MILCRTYHPLFLSFFFLILLSTFFLLSRANIPTGSEELSGGGKSGVGTIRESNTRRLEAETSSQNSSYLVLAADRTYRKDPLDNYRYYTGGWNITDPHYLSSLAFSAAGPLLAGAIWFFVFGLCLICICCRRCFCSRKKYGYSRCVYATSLLVLILLTTAVITGCWFLYQGQAKFETSIVEVSSYVLQEGDLVVTRLNDLVNNLAEAKDMGVAELTLPDETKAEIDNIRVKINAVSDNFRNVTGKSTQEIHNFLEPLRLSLIYLAAILLGLAVLGFVFSICGLGCLLYCLVILGWIIVLATFIVSGSFLLVYNAVTDTCVSVDQWLQNPDAKSALEKIIPRVNGETAQQMMNVTKHVTFGSVAAANTFIANVSNVDIPPDAGPPLYYNQSGPLVPTLCNPYSPDFSDRKCAPGEVESTNAAEVWKRHVCQVSDKNICTTPGRLTPEAYEKLSASAKVSYGLDSGVPFVVELIDSTFLKKLFGDISRRNCPSLRKYTEWMYAGFLTCTIAVMLSIIFWLIYSRERRLRSYTKKVDSGREYAYQFN